MPPRKASSTAQASWLPPTQEHPEEEERDCDDIEEEIGTNRGDEAFSFDRVVSPPSGRAVRTPARVTRSTAAARISTPRADIIAEQQSRQQEQLEKLFELVGSLHSDIRSVASAVADGKNARLEARAPAPKGKGKARGSESRRVTPSDAGSDDAESSEGEEEFVEYEDVDDYVSHAYYRDRITEGFSNRCPSRLANNKPAYFPIDDPVLRNLVASKYSAKAAEYAISVANAFFTSVTRAAVDDAIAATKDGDSKTAAILLNQVANNMSALEDMQRDRMLFLDLTSDPNASATERDFAANILRNEFTPGVQNKGGSAKSNKVFAAYQLQFNKATQFASAKASANRHLASTSGAGNGSSAAGGGNSGANLPDPNSKAQQKKKAEAAAKKRREAAAAADKAAEPKDRKDKGGKGKAEGGGD